MPVVSELAGGNMNEPVSAEGVPIAGRNALMAPSVTKNALLPNVGGQPTTRPPGNDVLKFAASTHPPLLPLHGAPKLPWLYVAHGHEGVGAGVGAEVAFGVGAGVGARVSGVGVGAGV